MLLPAIHANIGMRRVPSNPVRKKYGVRDSAERVVFCQARTLPCVGDRGLACRQFSIGSPMRDASARLFKTADELQAELDWAAIVLTGDRSPSRIWFAPPTHAINTQDNDFYNWDVEVSCRPDQDQLAQAAIQYVADKWRLVPAGSETTVEPTAVDAAPRAVDVSLPASGELPPAPPSPGGVPREH